MSATDSSGLCSSPARKRQRLSSPFEEYFEELSQEDLAALDKLEAQLSQGLQSPVKLFFNPTHNKEKTNTNVPSSKDKENLLISPNRRCSKSPSKSVSSPAYSHHLRSSQTNIDPENPFVAHLPSFTSAKTLQSMNTNRPISGFTSALNFCAPASSEEDRHFPSREVSPERDYSSWFEPAPIPVASQFQGAKFAFASSITSPNTEFSAMGFVKASNKGWAIPSHAALAQAEEKMRRVWEEEDAASTSFSHQVPEQDNPSESVTDPHLLPKSASHVAENAVASNRFLDSPTPGFSRPSVTNESSLWPLIPGFDHLRRKPKPFRSPLMKPLHSSVLETSTYPCSPLNRKQASAQLVVSEGSHQPLLATPGTSTPLTSFNTHDFASVTPIRPQASKQCIVGETPAKAKFVTPFKAGMRPGEPGHKILVESNRSAAGSNTMSSITGTCVTGQMLSKKHEISNNKRRDTQKREALKNPPNRTSLVTSGLVPQSYNSAHLEAMGIDATELSQITPTLALYYSFHTCSTTPLECCVETSLGPSAALEELHSRGCSLAMKPWVDNHWCLILWKLAGMVYLDPEAELDPRRKRWCWSEVIRQLLYRYERELNSGSRPPLRLIATHDSPASLPMVLCVSNIIWSEAKDQSSQSPHPEIEVTDGWYKIRAQVDQPLVRAIRRGVIRVGRKIAIAAARLYSERKEPTEILDAYNSTKLIISGNSSQLAPWHAKLGFQSTIPTATLNSLNPDGGVIAVMDIVVLKIFPLAFIEFIENEDGKTRREGPRNEKAEVLVNERWKRRREMEEDKLRQAWGKKLRIFEDYADRLERQAGVRACLTEDDTLSDDVEALLSDLEEDPENSRVLAKVKSDDAGRLARLIRERIVNDREKIGQDIEQELTTLCPPRQVRNFRVLAVEDACTQKRPANRSAQLTVWDVLNLRISEEGEAGEFKVGQRFRVTNLVPTQHNAWMGRDPGSEVYVCTRRDTRWTRMR